MKKYALRAFVGAVFLLILPTTVVYVASARTGVGLVQPWKDSPVAEYDLFETFKYGSAADHYISVAPELNSADLERIVRDIVELHYVGKRRMLFYFYTNPDIDSKSVSMPPLHLASTAYSWSTREGVQPYTVPTPRESTVSKSSIFEGMKLLFPNAATPEQE